VTETIRIPELGDDTNDLLNGLNARLDDLAAKNVKLDASYDAERNLSRTFGGVVPEQYYRLGLVLGWSAKAVDALARRCNLDGMVWPDGDLDSLGYRELWDGNRLGAETDQGITSALIHGLAFVVAAQGEPGEPGGLVHYYSASNATGVRNSRTRRLENLLAVNERDEDGSPSALTLYLDGRTVTASRDGGKWEVEDDAHHPFGVPAAPLVYRPRLNKPLGRTRLTRPVLGIQGAATRALVRLEGHMDVYAYPEFWLLGAGIDVFKNADGTTMSEMQRLLGRMKGIPDDQHEDDPALARADVKKFDASSPEPHLAAINAYSKLFARETGLPDSAVAITDFANPTSGESYDASQYELIAEAEGAVDEFDPALQRIVPMALAMQNGLSEVPPEWASITPKWRDPRYQTRAAMADAGQKQLAAVPRLAETEVGLELLGLSEQQIDRALADFRRTESRALLRNLSQGDGGEVPAEEEPSLNERATAFGAMVRSGATSESAAQFAAGQITIDQIVMRPGFMPVTIRSESSED